MLLVALLACSESSIRRLEPDLSASVGALDFEEVVVGTQRTGTLTLSNDGGGLLHLDGVELDGSGDFSLEGELPSTLEPHAETSLPVRYAPDAIGPDVGDLHIFSDDEDAPTLVLDLLGEGVLPELDLDPETLWFGDVAVGETKTLALDVNARGQGGLLIEEIGLVDDAGEVFSIALPEGYEPPLTLEPGAGFSLEVSFAPVDEAAWDAELYVLSNDPEQEDARVRLVGNSDEVGAEAPQVEITWPDWGNQIVAGETVTLAGVVVDDATPPEDLVTLWYADSALLGASTPDESGVVSFSTDALPEGEIAVRLVALDADGLVGEDEVDVTVYDIEEPTPYLLTGGSSVWDYWSIDDDVVITLDDVEVFRDSNDTQDSHGPLEIDAVPGQVLRIVATDVNACDQHLDALTLHWGTGASQTLNEEWCRSSCPSHACYDPDFDGPWPNVFLDLSYTITIP